MTIMSRLKNVQPSLSKAEARVAEAILSDPEAVVHMTTAELARLANVSDPMISRYCRTMGCKSFPDFKIQLAKSLVRSVSFISEVVSPGDKASHYIEKRINANQAALEYIRSNLQPELIERAVELLGNSKRIEIFGMGGAAAIAKDAHHKLFRLGIPTAACEDYLMQRMTAAAADQDTTILFLSFTGRTRSMVDVARIARDSKANIIAITHPGSPLAEMADITITSGNELEDTTIYLPMTTRIVVLTVIDILVTGLALSLEPGIQDHMKKIKLSLDDTKIY